MARANPYETAAPYLPPSRDLPSLIEAAETCRGCDLYRIGTQTVFGEGPKDAQVVLVGEQPGDHEDRSGRPFVGPAGGLLDRALEEAGISRTDVYVTNAVKHFKWTPKGNRRIHAKPDAFEVGACKPWLEAELEALAPRVVVALGATAAQSLLGRSFRVTQSRGILFDWPPDAQIMATIHPSAILRMDPAMRDLEMEKFVRDLSMVPTLLPA
jgi:DNA polymerase